MKFVGSFFLSFFRSSNPITAEIVCVCVCVLLCFVDPILWNRYGVLLCFYHTDIGESLRSRGQFLTAVDLG